MVNLINIKKAVVFTIENAIKGTEFEYTKIISTEIKEPIKRPSIKVSTDNSSFRRFNSKNVERNCNFEIFFFAENERRYTKDNYKMQQLLEMAFIEDIEVEKGFFVPVESIDCETSDTVLVCRIKLYTIELLPDTDTAEPMEEIIYS